MAKAIQCDICGQVVAQTQAHGWRTLTLNYRSVMREEPTGEEFDPRADVCSRECAMAWFEDLAQRCFPGVEAGQDGKERQVE